MILSALRRIGFALALIAAPACSLSVAVAVAQEGADTTSAPASQQAIPADREPPRPPAVRRRIPQATGGFDHQTDACSSRAQLAFTATAGSFRLFNDKGELQADIACTAYQLDNADRIARPVTFLF